MGASIELVGVPNLSLLFLLSMRLAKDFQAQPPQEAQLSLLIKPATMYIYSI